MGKRVVMVVAALSVLTVPALAFEGDYGVNERGYRSSARIRQVGEGVFDIKLYSSVPGCIADVDVMGQLRGNQIVTQREKRGKSICELTISAMPKGIRVVEQQCSDWHGMKCGFDGDYPRLAGAKAGQGAGPASAGPLNFYCKDAMNVDAARLSDPSFKVPPPAPGRTAALAYDYYFHEGQLGYDNAGDLTMIGGLKAVRTGNTVTYTAQNGRKWVAGPVGATRVTLRGPGLGKGVEGVACSWR